MQNHKNLLERALDLRKYRENQIQTERDLEYTLAKDPEMKRLNNQARSQSFKDKREQLIENQDLDFNSKLQSFKESLKSYREEMHTDLFREISGINELNSLSKKFGISIEMVYNLAKGSLSNYLKNNQEISNDTDMNKLMMKILVNSGQLKNLSESSREKIKKMVQPETVIDTKKINKVISDIEKPRSEITPTGGVFDAFYK